MRTAPWLLAIACVTTAPAAARQPRVEFAATVRQLHETMIKPASDVIFNVGREAPGNPAQWTAISTAGAALVTSGALLRAALPSHHPAKWIRLSRQLAAAGRTARTQAEARNLAAVSRTSDRLMIVCESCHAPYRTGQP